MAQPQKQELEISLVGHAMIGDTLGTPILQCDLLKEIQNLHKEDAWLQGTGPSSKTLVKHPDLRIVLLAMRKKMCMHEHRTAARISMLTLAGNIRLRLPGRMVELQTGHMLVLDECVLHDVEAEENIACWLTLSWQGQGSDTYATG